MVLEKAGEEQLDRSCAKMEKYYRINEDIQHNEGKVSGLAIRYVGTVFYSTSLKLRYKGGEEEEENVSSYCVTLSK